VKTPQANSLIKNLTFKIPKTSHPFDKISPSVDLNVTKFHMLSNNVPQILSLDDNVPPKVPHLDEETSQRYKLTLKQKSKKFFTSILH